MFGIKTKLGLSTAVAALLMSSVGTAMAATVVTGVENGPTGNSIVDLLAGGQTLPVGDGSGDYTINSDLYSSFGGTTPFNGADLFGDEDVYRFTLDGSTPFSASIDLVGTVLGAPYNPIIFLGMTDPSNPITNEIKVASNDPLLPSTTADAFSVSNPVAGDYYLFVTQFGNSPVSGNGTPLHQSNFDGVIIGGIEDTQSGNWGYTLNLSGVSAVPVPTAVWLFGSGLLGLIGVARRRG
ncbi:MAG: VPLPA-CTERM sorting domain-containing protein [Gammaproteobacteria bacterium]